MHRGRRDWAGQILYQKIDEAHLALYKWCVGDHDGWGTSFLENLSSDAGDYNVSAAGYPVSCGYVYGLLGTVFFSAQYAAGGGRCGVDDDHSDSVNVDIPYYNSICFQLCIPLRFDGDLDSHDD